MLKPCQYSLDNIREVIMVMYNVTQQELFSHERCRRIVKAREGCAGAMRRFTNASWPEIAMAMGRTYHSCLHTANKRFKKSDTVDIPEIRIITKDEFFEEVSHKVEMKGVTDSTGMPDLEAAQTSWPIFPTGSLELASIWVKCDDQIVGWVKEWKRPEWKMVGSKLVEI